MVDPTFYSQFLIQQETFTAFYNHSYASLCYFATRYTRDPLLAEDIVSDVALKVWQKRGELKNEAALKAYFYTSIRNTCIDRMEKEKNREKREKQYVDAIGTEESCFVKNMIRTEALQQLEIAIDALPHQCRKVFIKLFKEGKSLSEAADEMGLSIFTVKAQRQRGIKLLRARMTGVSVLLVSILSLLSQAF